jgi:hypothetical protein
MATKIKRLCIIAAQKILMQPLQHLGLLLFQGLPVFPFKPLSILLLQSLGFCRCLCLLFRAPNVSGNTYQVNSLKGDEAHSIKAYPLTRLVDVMGEI